MPVPFDSVSVTIFFYWKVDGSFVPLIFGLLGSSTTFFLIVTSDTIPERSQTKRGGYAIRFNSYYLCVKKRWKEEKTCVVLMAKDLRWRVRISSTRRGGAADPEHFYYI
jgi:hypothetical protein